MPNDVQEVKDRINIVDLAQQYLGLKKVGSAWKALCPFHTEKSPSFLVNEERQIYKCFGCGKGGDVLNFVMEMENLTFPEALHLLADRAGVVLDLGKTPTEYREEQDQKTRLYRLNKLAARFFHKVLLEHPAGAEARAYLVKRGINDQTITTFELGYAPKLKAGQLSSFEKVAKTKGFTTRDLAEAGHPERFRHRLMFPLFDTLGAPIGFTGRTLDPDDQPKYLNTPETVLFKKSRVLYPLHLAKDAIKAAGQALIFEGQTDVLLAHQLGSRNGVAASGTALTPEHLAILKRYAPEVVFVFDNDEAGREATRKALVMGYDLELEPSVISLPKEYKDLGELAVAKPDLWPAIAQAPFAGIEWQVGSVLELSQKTPLSVSDKKRVAQSVLPLLARIQDPIERAHWVQYVGKRIEVSDVALQDALTRSLKKATNQRSVTPQAVNEEQASTEAADFSPREEALGLVLHLGETFPQAIAVVAPKQFAPSTPARRVAEAFQLWYNRGEVSKRADLIQTLKAELSRADHHWVDSLAFEVEKRYPYQTPDEGLAILATVTDRLEHQAYEDRKAEVAAAIAAAEAQGDRQAVQQLLKEFQTFLTTKK